MHTTANSAANIGFCHLEAADALTALGLEIDLFGELVGTIPERGAALAVILSRWSAELERIAEELTREGQQ